MHHKLLWIFVKCILFWSVFGSDKVIVDKLPIETLRNYFLNDSTEFIINIVNLPCIIEETPPRVLSQCDLCTEDNPVLVVVRMALGVLSWELPLSSPSHSSHAPFTKIERTLCPLDVIGNLVCQNESYHELSVSLSTASATPVQVSLQISLDTEFRIKVSDERNLTISPATPRFLMYQFPDNETNVNALLFRVQSPDDLCMVVSLQHIRCPVYDLERNVQFDGSYQTITKSGGITISRESFPNGFYIVLVVYSQDESCGVGGFLSGGRTKKISVTLLETISYGDYVIAVSVAMVLMLFFCITVATSAFIYMRRLPLMYPVVSALETSDSISNIAAIQRHASTPASLSDGGDTMSIRTDSSLDETDMDLLPSMDDDKEFRRLKPTLFLCDLSQKKSYVLGKKAQLYLWYLLTVAVFYFLPVVQLVITYQKVLISTGNQNLCYYNFLCAHPLFLLSDFNHVFSNVGYVFLGTVFIFITYRRQLCHKAAVLKNKAVDKSYGIPQHFGLFYAMGAALIVEGILSGCYHVCPNQYNFQFDTSFMYVISTMCMLKIYHTRHPDVSASAWATFGVLALAILLGMCGVLDPTPAFWIFFTIVHLLTCFFLSLQIYYLGRWRWGNFSLVRLGKEIYVHLRHRDGKFFVPTYLTRFLTILAANAINWGIAAFGYQNMFANFATHLLAIFLANLMLYSTFYIIMKKYNKEYIGWTPTIYILLSIVSWAGSSYFFYHKSISWKLTPAESKLYNQPCQVLHFYDNHDIWHFLSAISMFFSFMVLLTLDDDLLHVPREQISVF